MLTDMDDWAALSDDDIIDSDEAEDDGKRQLALYLLFKWFLVHVNVFLSIDLSIDLKSTKFNFAICRRKKGIVLPLLFCPPLLPK